MISFLLSFCQEALVSWGAFGQIKYGQYCDVDQTPCRPFAETQNINVNLYGETNDTDLCHLRVNISDETSQRDLEKNVIARKWVAFVALS